MFEAEAEKAKEYIKLGKQKVHTKPKEVAHEQSGNVPKGNPEINPELLKMFSPKEIERIKKKELRKYKAAQDKKWRNYLESVNR